MTEPKKERTPEEIAMAVMSSEPMMWLMAGSNHQDSQIERLRGLWREYREAGGKSWGR